MIRPATPADAANLLSIYEPFILNTTITFEAKVPTEQDFAKRISSYLISWPWLVLEDKGIIAGYAYAGKHRERWLISGLWNPQYIRIRNSEEKELLQLCISHCFASLLFRASGTFMQVLLFRMKTVLRCMKNLDLNGLLITKTQDIKETNGILLGGGERH